MNYGDRSSFGDKSPFGVKHGPIDDSTPERNMKSFYSLDEALRTIEFPGSDSNELDTALQETRFTDRVMGKIEYLEHQRRAATFWLIFSLANLAILSVFGVSPMVRSLLLSIHHFFSHIFFFFLGLTFLGGVIGLIFTLDTSRMRNSVVYRLLARDTRMVRNTRAHH